VCNHQIESGGKIMGKSNGMAIASMVLGICGLCIPLCSIIALILGAVALSQISKTGQDGKGMAIAGLVLGIIGVAWRSVWMVLNLAMLGIA
jgi:uncharacterized protein DUF4190